VQISGPTDPGPEPSARNEADATRRPNLALLRRRDFLLLWTAGLVSRTGDWILVVGLPYFVFRLTGSTLATGTMLIAGRAPRVVLGSIAGVFVDRWDRRRTIALANVAMALGLAPLLLVDSAERLWIVYVVAFLEASLAQFFEPAEDALLPDLVDPEHLVAANALNSQNNQFARLIGSAAGGVAVGLWGLEGVALLDAGSFLVAAMLVHLISGGVGTTAVRTAGVGVVGAVRTFWREWTSGLQLLWRRPVGRMLLFITGITSVGEGIFISLLAPFVVRILRGDGEDFGAFLSIQAIGGIVGGLLVASTGRSLRPARLLGFASLVFGLLDLALFIYPLFISGMWLAFVLVGIVGLPTAAFFAGYVTLQQTSVPHEYRGRALGAFAMTAAVAEVIGMAAAGLADHIGIIPVLVIQGAVHVAVGVLVLAAWQSLHGDSATG
jgi:predicted MFS family arabinose efflux permease